MAEKDNPMFPEGSPKEIVLYGDLKQSPDSTVRELVDHQRSRSGPRVSGTSALSLQLNGLLEEGHVTRDGDPSKYKLTDEGEKHARDELKGLKNMLAVGEKLLPEVDPDQLSG